MDQAHRQAIAHIIRDCGSLRTGDRALVLCDERTRPLGDAFLDELLAAAAEAELIQVPYSSTHGTEPPAHAASAMRDATLIIGLTATSKAHTSARREACAAGARYLSMPEYSWDLLLDDSIKADYRSRARIVQLISDAFTAGQKVRVTTAAGTDLRLDIAGRIGNACPGYVDQPGSLGSPPDIEANVSPVETASEGTIVVDGSIPCPEIGLLRSPVTLVVKHGRIVRFEGEDKGVLATLERLFTAVGDDKSYVLAECGVGLNDKARITGIMLTDEGADGCMHFGFGSNATVGGQNDVPFHLDFVLRAATLEVDGKILIRDGVPLLGA